MSETMAYSLKSPYSELEQRLDSAAEIIEIELAERSLKQSLFGPLGSSELARTVAWEVIAMLRLTLQSGDLLQFRRQVEWEIGVALSHHQLFKLESDLILLQMVEDLMIEHIGQNLEQVIRELLTRVRAMFTECWQLAKTRWTNEHTASIQS